MSKSHTIPKPPSNKGTTNQLAQDDSLAIPNSLLKLTKPHTILVCIDLECTAVNENFYYLVHREISDLLKNNIHSKVMTDEKAMKKAAVEATKSLLKSNKLTVRNHKLLKRLITSLLNNGHKVAIITFISYACPIKLCLLEAIGLSKDQINNIHIITGFPGTGIHLSNIEHINIAMKQTGIKNTSDTILVSGNAPNIGNARKCGVKVVPVSENFSWEYVAEKVVEESK